MKKNAQVQSAGLYWLESVSLRQMKLTIIRLQGNSIAIAKSVLFRTLSRLQPWDDLAYRLYVCVEF